MRIVKCLLILAVFVEISSDAQDPAPMLRFEDYPVSSVFKGTPAAPILSTPEERKYRTRIQTGPRSENTFSGTWKKPIKGRGPNFAGRCFVIIWGCGSQCVMMATVDAKTGTVYEPPLARPGSLYVPLDNLSDMEVDFRPDSSLMVLRNACRDFGNRDSCGTYYFGLKDDRFMQLRFVPRAR